MTNMKIKIRNLIMTFLASVSLVGTMTSCSDIGNWNEDDIPPINEGDLFKDTSFSFDLYINGEKETIQVADGQEYIFEDHIPTIEGYKFDGWYLDKEYTTPCKLDKLRKVDNVKEIYVKMTAVTTSEIKVYCSDGSEMSYSVTKGSLINLFEFIPKINGKKFEGWYLDETYQKPYSSSDKIVLSSDLTLYAKYSDLELFEVTVVVNDKTIKKTNFDGTQITVSDFFDLQDGYIFDGWYYDAEFTSKAKNTITVTKDITLYIHFFEAKETDVRIYNNIDDSIITYDEQYVDAWFDTSLIETEKKNYIFEGWYLDKELTSKVETSEIRITEGMKLFAKYSEKEKITLEAIIPDTTGEYVTSIVGEYYVDDTLSLKELTGVTIPETINVKGWFYDNEFLKQVDDRETVVETLFGTVQTETIKVYAKCSCDLILKFNGTKTILKMEYPFGEKITFNEIEKLCGENYRVETINDISITENNEILLNECKEVKITGRDYTDFVLIDSFEYDVTDDGITITKYTGNNPIVKIPSFIEDKKVIQIGAYAFSNDLVSVTIPSTITKIDGKAFSNCKKIIEIYNLSSVNVNSKLAANIYNEANIESKLTVYENEYIIYNNNGTKFLVSYLGIKPKLTLPETLYGEAYSIYKYALAGKECINTLIIPEGTTEISEYAFSDCHNLIRVTLPKTLTTVKKDAFANCFNLLEIYNNSNITIVPGDADNNGLGQYAFKVFTKGEDYSDSLKEYLFTSNGYSYEYLIYNHEEKTYLLGLNKTNSETKVVYLPEKIDDNEYEIFHHAFYGNDNLISVYLPDTIEMLGNSSFENCTNLKDIELGSLKYIGNFAFNNCYKLSKVEIPTTTETIGQYAFANCSNLIEMKINDGVKKIDSFALSGLNSLLTLTIPDSVLEIGEKALYKTSNLTTLSIPFIGASRNDINYYYFGYIFGGISDESNINLGLPSRLKTLHITDDEQIEGQAFWRCTYLSEVVFYNTTTIKSSAFAYCTGLKTISLPTNKLFETIEEDAFFQVTINTIKLDDWNKLLESDLMQTTFFTYNTNETLKTKIYTYHTVKKAHLELNGTTFTTKEEYIELEDMIDTIYVELENGFVLEDVIKYKTIWANCSYTLTTDIKTKTVDGIKCYLSGSHITLNLTMNSLKYTDKVDVEIIVIE